MGLVVDWFEQVIKVTSPTLQVDAQTLHDFIEDQMSSPRGNSEDDIIRPEGKIEDQSNPGVFSQIIMTFNNPWQIQFWQGSGYTKIFGGKIISTRPDNQAMKATGAGGDITELNSPVDGLTVVSGSGVTEQDKVDIVQKTWDDPEAGTRTVLNSRDENL